MEFYTVNSADGRAFRGKPRFITYAAAKARSLTNPGQKAHYATHGGQTRINLKPRPIESDTRNCCSRRPSRPDSERAAAQAAEPHVLSATVTA